MPVGNRPDPPSSFVSTMTVIRKRIISTQYSSASQMIQNLVFVGGRILLHDPTDRRITIQESLEPLSFPPGSFIRPGVIQGANVAYRRAALTEVGGFDPWFGAGALYSGDETELMARISAAGWNGAYDPKPVVYHHHGRKTANDEWRLMRWYDRGRGAYYAKCMLNRRMRNVYFKNWLLTRRNHSWRTTALEIVGGSGLRSSGLYGRTLIERISDRIVPPYL